MLTPAQIDARRGKLTASKVACLMTADVAKIMQLYFELTEDPAFVEEDLVEVWPVRLGEFTEPLNLNWFELKRGPVSRRGEVVAHSNGWAACTLDGWSDLHGCPIETKHCGGHEPFEVLVSRYQPQLHWQMILTGVRQCALSIILAAREPIVDFVDYDEEYGAELWRRAEDFMRCVWSRTPPVDIDEPVTPPVPGKVYSFEGNNEWAEEAFLWLENIGAKRQADASEKTLKAMVPADAKKAFGHSITITRDRAGRLSLREAT
jgi:YqaJ-like viral recombinase domain